MAGLDFSFRFSTVFLTLVLALAFVMPVSDSATVADIVTSSSRPEASTSQIGGSATTSSVSGSSLQAYYRFDDLKASRGGSIEFDGQDDYIDNSNNWSEIITYNSSFTVSAWVRPEEVGDQFSTFVGQRYGSAMVFGLDNGTINSPGQLFLNMDDTRDGSPTSTGSLTAGEWQHVAVVYTGKPSRDAEFYINGQASGTSSADDGNGIGEMDSLYVGHQKRNEVTFPNDYFNGSIDDVRLYNRSLNASEMQRLYSERPVSDEKLVLHEDFDSGPEKCDLTGSSSCVRDLSPKNNSGTPVGFNDNQYGTGSGWIDETPLNRPSAEDFSGKENDVRYYGGNTGQLTGFDFSSSVSGWDSGIVGSGSLEFNQSEDVNVPHDSSQIPDSITVSAWINIDELHNKSQNIVHKECYDSSTDGWTLRFWYDSLEWKIGNGTVQRSETSSVTTDNWVHVAGTYSDNETRLYRSGELASSSTFEPGLGDGTCDISIGEGLNGNIDDARIYDKALSSAQISKLDSKENIEEGLVSRWNFEEADRKVAYDTAGVSSEGVLGSKAVEISSENNFTRDYFGVTKLGSFALSTWFRSDSYKFGDGSDGSLMVAGEKAIDENLTSNGRTFPDAVGYVVSKAGGPEVTTFSSPQGISEDDLVMVINQQGTATVYDKVGNYDLRRVKSVDLSEREIRLENELSENFGDASYQNVVVQRVPEYTDVTVDGGSLTVSDWSETSIDSCPSGWTGQYGECYRQVSSDSWSNVRSACRDYGGDLVRIDNSSVNNFVSSNYPDSWIGFRDISGSNDGGNDGEYEWVWATGPYYSYKNFASGEPSIGGVNNNPTVRIGSGGGWYTEYGGNNSYSGVCELNKKKGGLLAFKASEQVKTVNNGVINATGKGYRGGDCSFCGDDADGRAGEGIAGTGKYGFYGEVNNVNGGAGAGVNNNDGGDPAGGGGYGTPGGTSDRGHDGGIEIGSAELPEIYFGGGGGAGSDNDGGIPYSEDSHGGGIVYMSTASAKNLTVRNEGIDSRAGSGCHGVSGGGAGGTVYLKSLNLDVYLINATGGARDYSGDCGQEYSGAGGEGRIRVNTVDLSVGSTQPQPYDTGLIPNIVKKEKEYGLGGYRDVVYGTINNQTAGTAEVSDSGKWKNLVFSYNGSEGSLYLGGDLMGELDKNSISRNDNDLVFSGRMASLDEVKIYNGSLSSSSVDSVNFR